MKVYKVVCRKYTPNGHKFSSVLGNSKYDMEYKLNVKSIPEIGRLFGFDTFENALRFLKSGIGNMILEGEAENIGKVKWLARIHFVDNFWELKSKKKKLTDVAFPPTGTISLDSFTPEKIVYGEVK
jgi:hypothetical protein